MAAVGLLLVGLGLILGYGGVQNVSPLDAFRSAVGGTALPKGSSQSLISAGGIASAIGGALNPINLLSAQSGTGTTASSNGSTPA